MFERFTSSARRVIVLAQEEARLLNHGYIGTEHILLALIHEGQGVAAKTLESLGISRASRSKRLLAGQSRSPPRIFLSRRAPRRSWSCRCERACSSGTTMSGPSTSCLV